MPIAAYAFALVYEMSYLSYFDVDPELARVDASHLLLAFITCLAIGLAFVQTSIGYSVFRPRVSPLERELIPQVLLILFWAALLWADANRDVVDWLLLITIAFNVFVRVGTVLAEAWAITKERKCKFQAALRLARRTKQPGVEASYRVRKWIGPMFDAFILIALGAAIAHVVGYAEASTQYGFFVIEDEKPCIVLRSYSDYWICVPCDKEHRPLSQSYLLLTDEQLTNRPIRLLKPLRIDWKRREPANRPTTVTTTISQRAKRNDQRGG